MRKILAITLASVVAVLAAQTSAHAAQPFDGLWTTSRKDCRDKDGLDSKTFIDLDNVIKGKPAPLVDQYENHCRVDRKTPAGDGLVLTTTCFEFWDDYNKGANGRKVTIKISPGPNDTLRIDGKPYLLCKRKSDLPKEPVIIGFGIAFPRPIPNRGRLMFKFARRPDHRSVYMTPSIGGRRFSDMPS